MPTDHSMSLRVYNTLSQQKELFQTVRPGKVGMYLCGPTVYKSPHIGHMVGPVIFDAIKRYLVYKGYEVTWVVNITDVEDKLIDASNKTGRSVTELAEHYSREYFEVLSALGIDTIDHFPRASDHIAEIIGLCQTLIGRGFAYAAEGNVYFDVTADDDYGKLSHRRVEEQESGTRSVESAGKRNPADFALWKSAKADEPSWESPWGSGRPGWHIECSAMAMKLLGKTFDIHGGGMDLMFPHHENEIAQSESATGQTFARYWLHNGLTRLRTKLPSGQWADEKMSGSIGNVVSAKSLIDRHGAALLRYLLLSTHYRSPIDFSDEVVTSASKGLAVFERLRERIERLLGRPLMSGEPGKDQTIEQIASELSEGPHEAFARSILDRKMKFLEMMDDDFNTAGAIAVLHETAGEINSFIEKSGLEKQRDMPVVEISAAAVRSMRALGNVIGLFIKLPQAAAQSPDDGLVEGLMQLLIRLRATARAEKNFAIADAVRKGLTELNITLEDRPDGTTWRKA